MERPLDLLDQVRHVVQRKTGPQFAEVASLDPERLRRGRAASQQPTPQCLVDDVAEGPTSAARFGLELGGNIVVQG